MKESMHLFIRSPFGTLTCVVEDDTCVDKLIAQAEELSGIVCDNFYLTLIGGRYIGMGSCLLKDLQLQSGTTIDMRMRVMGGMDFQNREGSKVGSGGMLSESQAAIERRERLRKLALETIDISKDPYFMRNHLGTFECKLCLTLHKNEGNYLAHTQGKRHQSNLGRRAAMEEKNIPIKSVAKDVSTSKAIKIGRPGYKVVKSRDLQTQQRSITFEVDYPESSEGCQPRHRFMSAYEQKVEPPDKQYAYLLFACDPYETIAFKVRCHRIIISVSYTFYCC